MLLIAGLEDRPDNYTAEWSRLSGKMFSLCFLLQDFIYHVCKTSITNQGTIHDQCWLMYYGFRPLQRFTNLALISIYAQNLVLQYKGNSKKFDQNCIVSDSKVIDNR